MALELKIINRMGINTDTFAGPDTETVYVDLPEDFRPDKEKDNEKITLLASVSGALALIGEEPEQTSSTLTVELYGRLTPTGDPILLKSDLFSGNLSTSIQTAVVDLNSYPMPYYALGFTSDADNSGIDVDLTIVN